MTKTAIIGLSCLFPGALTLESYWRNLLEGRDCRTEALESDFGLDPAEFTGDGPASGRIYSLRGGYVRDFAFDGAGLDLDPEVLAGLDPSFLWALHAARDAVNAAGPGAIGADAGLILGNYTFPTASSNRMTTPLWRNRLAQGVAEGWNLPPETLFEDGPEGRDPANRYVCGMPAALASRALGLNGPSFSLDAACSSALYAIDLAMSYLRAGKARSMLAGALCAPDPWLIHLSFSNLGAYPPNGISQPFDTRSQGIVTGQGASVAALKLLDHAIEDGDDILCVIDGVGLSNDGAGRHMLAPNPRGQALAYERAYDEAGIDPALIDYIECHATGTPLGDRTEIGSLTQFFEPRGGQPRFGSVKANLGHLLTVAGMSSLAKVAMAMREGTIPATIGVEATAKGVGGLVRRTESWPSRPAGQPRRAAISAFGFGGANAHMIVSAHDPAAPESAPAAPEPAPAARPIAITGMAAHFGSLTTLEAFGEAAFSGRSSVAPASIRRVRGAEAPAEGAFVEEIALDPLSSCVPPIETTHFNPQHALSIRVCEAALKDAGYRRGTREPRNVAVIVALELDLTAHLRRAKAELPQAIDGWAKALGTEFTSEEHGILLEKCGAALHGEVKSAEILSYIGNICAGRISSIWNFTGPSYTISADGLGAAYALQAAQMLVSEGRAEAAVVAAVDLGAGFEDIALGAASPPGEGAGAIVLAPLDGAGHAYALLEHAVLRRGHDREHTLFSLPDAEARAALDEAGIAGAGYADLPERLAGCCAEGTVRGDVTGLVGANPTLQPMAGLIRLVLSLWRRVLPTQTGPLPWIRQTPDEILRAVLGSEGLGGACAAISVIEAPVEATRLAVASEGDGLHFLPVQGETPAALKAEIRNLIEALDSSAPLALIQREAVLAARPGARGLAAALVGENRAALLTEAQRLLEAVDPCMASMVPHQTPLGSYFTPRPLGHEGHVAFVYPGGFNSYPFLGRDLLRAFPDALRLLEQDTEEPAASLCARSIYPRDIAPTDTGALMRHEAAMMDDITTMIVSGASFALIYSDILRRRFGIGPGAEFGYSLGETSMLFATNAWPAQARRIGPVRESELLATGIAGPKTLARRVLGVGEGVRDRDVWSSLVLFADADTVLEAAQGRQDLFVTHVNTPRETVIAGRPAALREFAEALGAQTFRSPVSHVLHCDVLRHAYDEVFALNDLPCMPPSGESVLYTARTNAPLTRFERPFLSENTAEVMCSTVDFRRLAQRVHADGARIFIECGPSATCTRWIGETLADRPHLAIAMDQRGAGDMKTLLRGIARLYAHGVALDLSSLVPEEKALARRATVHVRTGGAALAEAGQAAALAIGARPTRRAPRADLVYGPGAGLLFPEPSPMAEPALPSSAPVPVAAAPRPAAADTLLASAARDLFATEDAYLGAQTALARAVSRSVEIDAETEARIVALLDLAPPGVPANANGGPVPAPLAAPKPPLRVVPAGPEAPTGATPQAASRATAPGPRTTPRAEGVIWDEHDLLNFADGRVSDVFGPEFAEIDGYPVRVRLPSKPYFFVSRVTRLDAEPGAYRPCSLTTEYDIPEDAWYLVDGQMPPGIAVEAGQSDLLLVAYLGIDFRNRGLLKYRLLDGKLAFRGPLPRAGQTLRFDIDIHSFVWQGDNLLFFFRYKGYVDGELALELESGCAGFFSEEQLEAGGGVVLKGQRPLTETLWKPVQPTERTALDRADMLALVEGRLADVFGERHRGTGRSMRLPPEMLLMADRVTDLGSWREEAAGRVFTIEAEKDLDPEGWYYRSHFVDDPVLPGSLAAEGATQVLKAYLLANGFHLTIADPEFDSIPGLEMVIRVRGQITPKIDRLRYEVRVIETGLLPRPFIRADVVIWHGSKPLVQVSNLGLRIREKAPVAPRLGDESWDSGRRTAEGGKVLLSELHLAHAAKGDLGTAMGEGFGIYGPDHRAPHIPNGCFQFVDRGIAIDGARGVFRPGATMVNEYDSPRDAWYYTENSYPRMPNCVYLEGALQAAILLGYYLGPTLKYPQNVYSIRNLDGKAVYLADIDTRGQTLRHHETLKSNALVPDSILQSFDFRVECAGTPLYEGWSSFGYFTEKALAVQLGLDNGRTRNFWHEDTPVPLREIDLGGAEAGEWFAGRPGKPHYRLAGGRFRLLHRAWLSGTGGRHGLGYVKGYREVREDDWYFTNHFHRDPVQPGSLGLESMLQSIQLFALANGIGAEFRNPRFGIAVGVPVEWKYRGQILRKDRDMFTETHIREVRREDGRIVLIADADLFNDRLPIYQTTSMSVAITEAGD